MMKTKPKRKPVVKKRINPYRRLENMDHSSLYSKRPIILMIAAVIVAWAIWQFML